MLLRRVTYFYNFYIPTTSMERLKIGYKLQILCLDWPQGVLSKNAKLGALPSSRDLLSDFGIPFYPNVTTLRSGLCYCKSVCRLSSVCNVGAPYSGGWNFRQYFFTAVYAGHPLTSCKILRRSSQGNPSIYILITLLLKLIDV